MSNDHEHNARTDADALADMVARVTATHPATISPDSDDSRGLTLANTIPIDPNVPAAFHPEQHWNGRREMLGSWIAEFETTLSAVSPELHEFAVEFFLSDRNKTIIFFSGQAAQLDGVLQRPDYDWFNPAPSDEAEYNVPHHVVAAAYVRLHRERCLRDANLDPNVPPVVPADAEYPVDYSKYVHSPAMLHAWQMRLRIAIQRFISDLTTRSILGRQFPRDGRALLLNLHAQARAPLSVSQVNSVNAETSWPLPPLASSATTLRASRSSVFSTTACWTASPPATRHVTRRPSRPCAT